MNKKARSLLEVGRSFSMTMGDGNVFPFTVKSFSHDKDTVECYFYEEDKTFWYKVDCFPGVDLDIHDDKVIE